jgi:hypothetical protein
LQKLDAGHFARTAQLIDDDLETVAQINTSPGFTYRGGFTERVRSDNFLRASISKSDGRTLFQVYQTLLYTGGHRNFVSANYQTSAGPRSVPLIRISSNVSSCASAGFCLRAEDVAFEVPEEVLRSVAAAGGQPWRYRLNAQAGESWDDNLSPSEVAGLLSRVDAYRAARK